MHPTILLAGFVEAARFVSGQLVGPSRSKVIHHRLFVDIPANDPKFVRELLLIVN
jgi:hypothetical protein